MPVGTGLSTQVGWGIEATPGSAATINAWAGGVLSESLQLQQEWITSAALRAGRRTRRLRVPGTRQVSGNIVTEVSSGDVAMLLRQAVGTETITGVGPYVHTFVPTTASELPSVTVEVVRPSVDGTARRFTDLGCKVQNWELSVNSNEFVTMSVDYVGMAEATTGAISTPTYTTVDPFTFAHATLTLGGTSICFDDFTLRGANNLSVTNLICTADPRAPKVRDTGFHEYSGSINKEFEDLTIYNAFVAGTPATFSMLLNAGATSKLEITGQVVYDGETPTVSGPDVIMQSVPFTFMHATADASAFSAILTNSVSTPVS